MNERVRCSGRKRSRWALQQGCVGRDSLNTLLGMGKGELSWLTGQARADKLSSWPLGPRVMGTAPADR